MGFILKHGFLLLAAQMIVACAASSPARAQSTQQALPPGVTRFQRAVINDPQTGLDAYDMLVPADWKWQGKIFWDLTRTAAPYGLVAHASDSDNGEGFTALPAMLFCWSPMYAQNSGQLGGKVQGCPILRPSKGPVESIRNVIIPVYLKSLAGKYTVLSSQELPKVAAAYAPTYDKPGQPQGTVRAGKIRIEYQDGARTKQAEIVCVYLRAQSPSGIVWGLDHITLVYALKGSLDSEIHKLNMIAMSLQITPKFQTASDQVTQMLIQQFYQDQAALMQRAAAAAQAQQKMSDEQMSHWEANENARFNAVENYDDGAIRGVVNYFDPHSNDTVQIPDDATHVWSDGGQIIYTDNENFKPSQYENGDWQELQPVQH